MLARSARIDPVSDADHIPLNLACEHGLVVIVELLLKQGSKILPNAEGLYPQHLVARSGRNHQLLILLKEYGADLDQIDKLYSWTPLFHAASEGNIHCLRTLLDFGVQVNVLDEKGLSAMYYAAWEGHLECMRLISSASADARNISETKESAQKLSLNSSSNLKSKNTEIDAIPELELPPPIIPLRRYGHSFLDTKILIQISFDEDGHQPLTFFHDSKYPAARLTLSSKLSELIPKNILLPFQEDTRIVSFQTDSLDSFAIDFDVFPTYGAKIIAKTVALPHTFQALKTNSGRCCLPLFDPRLRVIGQIIFNFQVIKPFPGRTSEITDFATYWKATSQLSHRPNAFITDYSLSGEYVQLLVQQTCDGTPVLWPNWTINHMGIELPVSSLTFAQFILAGSHGAKQSEELIALQNKPLKSAADFHRIFSNSAISLRQALENLPRGMHVNLQILYPTVTEEKALHVRPANNIDSLCDAILTVVFNHARMIRDSFPDATCSVIFSSFNPTVCTALNWKQPNYPIFLKNGLGSEIMPFDPTSIVTGERQAISIKEAVRIAKDNNFMGLCCSSVLLVF